MALAVQQPERLQRVRKPPIRSEGPVVAQATHSAVQKAPSFDGAFFHALHSFIHLKRRPFGRPIKVVFSMAFATTGPLRASLDQCPSAATMHPPLGRAAQAAAPLPSSFCVHSSPWVGSVCEAHAQLPLVSSTHGWTAQARLQQVLDKADAIVLEHHAIAFLGCVEIDIGANGEIMVAIGIAKGLLHMPNVLHFLIGFVDSQKRH